MYSIPIPHSHTVSPHLVSPESAIGSSVSDLSPNTGWSYAQLPQQPYATPLHPVTSLPQTSPEYPLGMVPVQPHHSRRASTSGIGRAPRTRSTRQSTSRTVKREINFDEDSLSEHEDTGSALGLTHDTRSILSHSSTSIHQLMIE
jgi:hypothetical protein